MFSFLDVAIILTIWMGLGLVWLLVAGGLDDYNDNPLFLVATVIISFPMVILILWTAAMIIFFFWWLGPLEDDLSQKSS